MLYLSEEMINIHQITRIFYYTDRRKREKNDTKKRAADLCRVPPHAKGRGQYA
jgi:hypothetical protein